MKLIFSEEAWDDYLHWQKTDPKLKDLINALIKVFGSLLIAQLRFHY